tara:strand:- start:6812 stop:6988 length:177 start_codon:yes stop_codon:yes gene_type:complete
MLNKLYFLISKLKKSNKGARFRLFLLIIPTISFLLFLSLSPSADNQNKDADVFEYEQF